MTSTKAGYNSRLRATEIISIPKSVNMEDIPNQNAAFEAARKTQGSLSMQVIDSVDSDRIITTCFNWQSLFQILKTLFSSEEEHSFSLEKWEKLSNFNITSLDEELFSHKIEFTLTSSVLEKEFKTLKTIFVIRKHASCSRQDILDYYDKLCTKTKLRLVQ